jgi:hypothetical protein
VGTNISNPTGGSTLAFENWQQVLSAQKRLTGLSNVFVAPTVTFSSPGLHFENIDSDDAKQFAGSIAAYLQYLQSNHP